MIIPIAFAIINPSGTRQGMILISVYHTRTCYMRFYDSADSLMGAQMRGNEMWERYFYARSFVRSRSPVSRSIYILRHAPGKPYYGRHRPFLISSGKRRRSVAGHLLLLAASILTIERSSTRPRASTRAPGVAEESTWKVGRRAQLFK